MNNYYCDYCQEQDLKEYIINSLGDVFCNNHCHEQMKQFYKGEYEIVECLKCDNRFISYDHQDEHIVCKHCNNQDREETIFLSLRDIKDCDCNQCEQIKKEVNK